MRRRGRIGLILALIVLGLALYQLLAGGFGGARHPQALALTPAPTPEDGRQVAVLTLHVSSNAAGQVVGVEMVGGRQLPGYGPNVANRPGAWTVSLTSGGSEALTYGLPDPRQVRVEGESAQAPHGTMVEPDIEFDLIAPLATASGEPLSVDVIRLFDQSGRLIFGAGLRGREIVPLDVKQLDLRLAE